jgi:metallo-beta-lactamase family protein
MDIQFLGACGRVTGSCYWLSVGGTNILLECGLIQGGEDEERENAEPLPLPVDAIDAVILSHAHIDHSGRLPLLAKQGYTGPIYTHPATRALCAIMLRDSAYLQEKDAEWANRKRRRKGLAPVDPLYTQADAEAVMDQFRGVRYGERTEIAAGVEVRFRNAGHILGSAIVEIWLSEGGRRRKLVFSGDLGFVEAPVMPDPEIVEQADLVMLESTYGDRLHRSADDTLTELSEVFSEAHGAGGNILIPAFAVGRTQDLLYLMSEHYDEWDIGRYRVFLDSPMAIEATTAYAQFRHLYESELFRPGTTETRLPNLTMSRTSEESMAINRIEKGVIVIAGSGMCSGGRIIHHLRHNLWRPECHVVIVGFQAYGTLGRRLVDGAEYVRIFGEEIKVNATLHTIGGLSAHADQAGLLAWYRGFSDAPPVCLVHGEDDARTALARKLEQETRAETKIPALG